MLRCPDFEKSFYVQTDASGHRNRAVLSQHHEDGEHVAALYLEVGIYIHLQSLNVWQC